MPTPLDPRALLGGWVLARTIEDRYAGQRTHVSGRIDLTSAGAEGLRWDEQGLWYRPGGTVAVRRALWVRQRQEGWWVLFEDGRPFHPWMPESEVVHPCGADVYRGLVTGAPARWTIRWDVAGPAKDYTMTSVLTPAPEGRREEAVLSRAAGRDPARPAAARPRPAGS